jgi:hypothetical protein
VANTGIISAHRRLRQDNPKFKARLGNIARPCLKKTKARRWWLSPVNLATQEAEVSRIAV